MLRPVGKSNDPAAIDKEVDPSNCQNRLEPQRRQNPRLAFDDERYQDNVFWQSISMASTGAAVAAHW
ncbi:MAG: hypothetical protein QGH08_03270 [Arenicellales bacterium]|nr:hypothetical protein [Arenicellales bacterium]MDP7064048.1 hypothetical protein [Arenicellales bacterium]